MEAAEEAAPGVLRSTAAGALREAPMEMAQGGQERLAANLALQDEGFDTPTMQGVVGSAVLEGLAGGGFGGGFGAVEGVAQRPSTAPAGDMPAPADDVGVAGRTPTPHPVADASRTALLDGVPQPLADSQYQPADLEVAVAQQLFRTEVDDTNPEVLRFHRYDRELQRWEEVPEAEARAAAQARIREAEQLGEDPFSPRMVDQLLPDVGLDSGPRSLEQLQASPAVVDPEGEMPLSTRMGLDPNAGPLSAAAVLAVDSGTSAPPPAAGGVGGLPLPAVDMDSGPQAVEALQAAPVADDPGYEFRVQNNGQPFRGERDIRLLKAFREAEQAGQQPVAVRYGDGWAVAVRRPSAPAAEAAAPVPATGQGQGQGQAAAPDSVYPSAIAANIARRQLARPDDYAVAKVADRQFVLQPKAAQGMAPAGAGHQIPVTDAGRAVVGEQGSAAGDRQEAAGEQPPTPFYRLPTGRPARGMKAEPIRRALTTMAKSWSNAPPISVVQTIEELPPGLLQQLVRDGAVDAEGVFHDGQVYLVAANLDSIRHAAYVLAHEVLGHAGLQGAFGNRLNPLLNQIYRDDAAIREAADWLMERFGYSKQVAVEEVLADMAADGQLGRQAWWPRLVAAVRNALRVAGFNLQWSEADVRGLLANARRHIEGGRRQARGGLRLSRGDSDPLKPEAQEEAAFRAAVERALKVPGQIDRMLTVGQTPAVLQRLGVAPLPVAIAKDTILKASNGVKHDVRVADVMRLPELLADPVMVFDSATEKGALVLLTDAEDASGRPVVVALHLNRKQGFVEINRVASLYGKDGVAGFVRRELDAGRLRYAHTRKSPEWLRSRGLQLPKENTAQGVRSSVITERDLVKAEGEPDARYSRAGQRVGEVLGRLTGQRRPDANDPFAEENRRLREQDRTLWKRARQEFRRQFAPGGLLPTPVFDEKVRRDSEFQAVEFDVRHLVGGLEKAAKADYGVSMDAMTDAQLKPLSEALAGRVPDAMPESTRVAVLALRQYIDTLSGEYVGTLQQQVRDNLKGADPTLIETIIDNIGAYVHRSYRAFDDPTWFRKVPVPAINTARRHLAAEYQAQGESETEARRLADVTVNELLKSGTAYDSMEAFIAEGKLGAKDLGVLMKRKQITPEIRALLGEYTDPRLNFAKSATKMARLIWNQRFLDRVRGIGMGTFLFEGKDRPAGATAQIAGEQSDTYAPLNGLWTFPEVAQSFKDALGKEQMGDLYRAIVRMNGMVKYGKTVLSPTTAMRNWQSAMFFSLANGHFDLTQMKKSLAAFREQVAQNATGDDLAYLRKLKQLGVVYDTPYAGEMMRLLDDARMEELLSGKSGAGLKWLRKISQVAQGFYSFGDDFWKIIGFENEKASLIKAGISEAHAEQMAAERIRNTYPTYSMVGRGINWLRRFPLAGTFVSFPAEIVRTSANMLRMTAADLKSDNPGIRALGRKRAAGLAMVSAGFYALSALTAAALGVDDDEEEALRDLAAPWQKNSTLLFAGRDADGKLRYFDMSFLDPYGYWKRPLTAMLRDQPWEQAATSALSDMLSPFLGADITAGALFEVMANKKGSGGKVYLENGGAVDQTVAIVNHLRKALQPGFASNAERLWLAGQGARREGSGQPYDMRDEVVSLLGWRASTLDTRTALYYRSFEFSDALVDARKVLTRTLRSSNQVSDADIRSARDTAQRQYEQAFREMTRLVRSARAAGMNNLQIAQTLRLSGISKANAIALLSGQVPPMTVGLQSLRSAVKQAGLMQGADHAAEVARRFSVAQ